LQDRGDPREKAKEKFPGGGTEGKGSKKRKKQKHPQKKMLERRQKKPFK